LSAPQHSDDRGAVQAGSRHDPFPADERVWVGGGISSPSGVCLKADASRFCRFCGRMKRFLGQKIREIGT